MSNSGFRDVIDAQNAGTQRIVDLREERGGFSTVDELLDVSGIGEATLEKIRPYVYVESELEGME